ncbi:MAG: hypothetical protein R2753_10575 [Chitinophagales bacterium]
MKRRIGSEGMVLGNIGFDIGTGTHFIGISPNIVLPMEVFKSIF